MKSELIIIIILIIVIIITLICVCCCKNENFNNPFPTSSVSPFKQPAPSQGIGFKRPPNQVHENCLGSHDFEKSKLKYNHQWGNENNNNTIAILFITRETGPQFQHLWEKWFNSAKGKLKGYIHYSKQNSQNVNFAKKINTVENTYENIVPAMIALIEEVMKDSNNKGCLFVSESCIPIKSPAHIYNTIINSNSTFNFVNENLDKSGYQCYLTRPAMKLILDEYKKFTQAKGYNKTMPKGGNNELLFPQILKEHPEITTNHGVLTFFCFYTGTIKHFLNTYKDTLNKEDVKKFEEFKEHYTTRGNPHRRSFITSVSPFMLKALLNYKAFFARKFDKDCKVDTVCDSEASDLKKVTGCNESLEDILIKEIC